MNMECGTYKHEMTAIELLYAERKMYNEDSAAYAEYSDKVIAEDFDDAIAYMENWLNSNSK